MVKHLFKSVHKLSNAQLQTVRVSHVNKFNMKNVRLPLHCKPLRNPSVLRKQTLSLTKLLFSIDQWLVICSEIPLIVLHSICSSILMKQREYYELLLAIKGRQFHSSFYSIMKISFLLCIVVTLLVVGVVGVS